MTNQEYITIESGTGAKTNPYIINKQPPIITFTISGTTEPSYQAVEGMTWSDWVASSYNTIGVTINTAYTDAPVRYSGQYIATYGCYGCAVSVSDVITDGASYMTDNSPT